MIFRLFAVERRTSLFSSSNAESGDNLASLRLSWLFSLLWSAVFIVCTAVLIAFTRR